MNVEKQVLYASNVHHYHHVVRAMLTVYGDLRLVRRWEPSEATISALERFHTPLSLRREISRRASIPLPRNVEVHGFGPRVTVDEILAKALHRSKGVRWRTERSARSVARYGGDVLQFVEGLGFESLKHSRFAFSIMERRNLHHAVFEGELTTYAGFPFEPKADILGDILDVEYELSNRIVVYSEAARESFLSRGFEPAKVVSIPLAFAPTSAPQGPESVASGERFLYVGRGDAFKGIDVASEAVRLYGRGARLRVAGPFTASARAWLETQRHVDYLGVLTRRELQAEYTSARALIAPSVESFGLAIIDAAAAGLHVMCLPTSGVGPELPSDAVTVVPTRYPTQWAQALTDLRETGGVREASAEVRARWTWEESERRMFEFLCSLGTENRT